MINWGGLEGTIGVKIKKLFCPVKKVSQSVIFTLNLAALFFPS
jgi:hypothetical protein